MLVVDILIVLVLAAYALFGYRRGFIAHMAELVGFVVGFALAFLLYRPLGDGLAALLRLPEGIVDLMSFLLIWFGVEMGISFGWRKVAKRIPANITHAPANRLAGIAPALVKGLFLVVILLLIVATSPLPTGAKDSVTGSTLGKGLLSLGTAFQQQFNNLFGQAFRDTLAFKTVKTDSSESVNLGFTSDSTKVCEGDENDMVDLVNKERRSRGVQPVSLDTQLRAVGRAHSQDMLARGYFSHVNPDGLDPFERMDRAGIDYTFAGENLAFAPTLEIAHSGLMNSPGHKANILKPEFNRLGVGCIDAGIRGRMFSQEFTG